MHSHSLGDDETRLPENTLLSLALDFRGIEVISNYSQSHTLSISCNILYIGL